jgi:hypothetical protein
MRCANQNYSWMENVKVETDNRIFITSFLYSSIYSRLLYSSITMVKHFITSTLQLCVWSGPCQYVRQALNGNCISTEMLLSARYICGFWCRATTKKKLLYELFFMMKVWYLNEKVVYEISSQKLWKREESLVWLIKWYAYVTFVTVSKDHIAVERKKQVVKNCIDASNYVNWKDVFASNKQTI